MSFITLAFAYLRRRAGQALLSVLIGAMGVAAVTTAIVGFDALPRAARHAWGGVDLVVGPKGSALDLVLCCALHVSDPRGLVSTKAVLAAVANPMVRSAAPIALGDNVAGWRIVGTTPALLAVYRARLASGGIWTEKLQAVVGAVAARELNFRLGDSFVGAHGLASGGEQHDKFPYKVVGILAPTGSVLDRLVLTDIETVRYVHVEQAKAEKAETGATDEEEIDNLPDAATAILVSYRSPTAAAFMPRQVDATEGLTGASPTFEIARLLGYARPLITAAAAVGLMATMNARTRDLALLRALGASRARLAFVAFAEAAMIAAAALVLGGLLSFGLLMIGHHLLAEQTGLLLEPVFDIDLAVVVIGGTIAVTIAAAAFPAFRASRAQIEELLQS